ncbi:MAG TPA: tetratricopeptide repeat protein [Blastocatellia bacterium]|nr:tetratricopeptide repeat protein [Blastocatellia bacterium]
MKEVGRKAAGKAIVVVVAAASISVVAQMPAVNLEAASESSCVSSLDQGKDLLGQRQFSRAENLLVEAAKNCPKVAEIFETLGLTYDFDGRHAQAQTAYRQAISINPGKAEFHNNLATSLLRSEQPGAAISEFQKAIGVDPANKAANLNLATLQIAKKDYVSALHFLQAAHVERSQDPLALYELTEAYFGAGDDRAAHETATLLAKLPKLEPAVHFSLGLLMAQHEDYNLAAQQFAAIPEADRDAAADVNLGMAYSELRRLQEAREAYEEAIRRDPSNPDPYLHIGLDAAAAGNDEAALDWITQASVTAPDRPDISDALLHQLIRVGNFERARQLLDSAMAARSSDPALLEIQADLLRREGHFEQAAKAYRKVLALQPRRVSARIALASAYEQLQQSDKATNELEDAIQVDPRNAEAKAQLGHLAIEAGNQDAAGDWTRQALALDPNNLTANEDRAMLMERAGSHGEAQIILEKLVRLEPKNPRVHYLLGRVLLQLQKPEEAQTQFDLSKKLEASEVQRSD